mmetsp:Transcript_22159/g.52512  ORF Transcript_22159/g.52512 Transcript_22159/m.52512 type:complete len:1066 (-) Transcript_22159:1005-4202(-)
MAESPAYRIDPELFWERAQKLYNAWKTGREPGGVWAGADALVIDTGKYDEQALYLKSSSLHNYLIGLEMPDTVIIFTQTMIYVLAGSRKVSLMEPLQSKRPDMHPLSLLCYTRTPKADKDAGNYATLCEKIKGSFDGKKVAMLLKESPMGDAAEAWRSALTATGATILDLGPMLADLLLVKDEAELQNLKCAGLFTSQLLTIYALPVIEEIVDEKKPKSHADLAAGIEEYSMQDDVLSKLKIPKEKISDKADLDTCYTPIIQSGGKFNLKPSAESNEEMLHGDGVITVSIGGRYKSYCTNVGRTYVINATAQQKKEYAALSEAEDAVIAALKPGVPASEVLAVALSSLNTKDANFGGKLVKTIGFATGLEFRDSSYVLSAKNDRPLKKGMVLTLTLGLENLENTKATDDRSRTYAIFLSDTVVVGEDGGEVLTSKATKKWADVSYEIKDDEPEVKGKNKEKDPLRGSKNEILESRTRNKSASAAHQATDEQLREHQSELEDVVTREALRRLDVSERGGRGGGAGRDGVATIPTAYKGPDDYPREMSYNQICVDSKAESVLIPIFGTMVPFHISTIKNVTKSEEGQYTYLRINFAPPGMGMGTAKETGGLVDSLKGLDSIREITVRARDPKNLNTTFRMVKELRTRVMRRDKEEDQKKGLVAQESLRMLTGARAHRLRDVNMRPHPSGRKSQGTLEIQANGVRFTTNKGERVDLAFKNMKNCFYQPSHKEHLVLIHFHLHDAIMVGKKKHFDIQFYVEVVEQSYALDQARRGGYDPDELEEEQRERALRNRMNAEFKTFAQKIEEQAGDIEFDIPYRELGFHGLINKTTSLIMPTVNALVELIEFPWLVVQIGEIEIVHFERVIFGLKNFDMMIVFKDLKKDPIQIGTINMQQLDQVKTWLDSCNIKFYEGVANLHWPAIMKTVREDPRGFYEGDSWRFLDLEQRVSDEEGSSEEEEESSFAPTGSEESAEDDSDDSEAGSGDDSDDSDASEGSLDSDESSGKSWDELEATAGKDDRKRGDPEMAKAGKKRRKDEDSFGSSGGSDDDSEKPKKKKSSSPKVIIINI